MQPDTIISDEDMTLLDKIAGLTLDPDNNLQTIRELYAETETLHPPKNILA